MALDHSIFEEETGIIMKNGLTSAEGDDIDLILHHSVKGHQPTHSLGYKLTHSAYAVYWVFISIGLVLGFWIFCR